MDQRSNTTSHFKWYSNTVQYGKPSTNRVSWFINEFSSSSLPSSTSMTLSRQEIDHPKSSSSSSTSTSMTSSTEIDRSDHPPAIVSSESVDRQARGDPYSSETSEELLNKPTKIPKPNKNENPEQVRKDPYYSDIPEWLQEFRESRG